MRWTAITVHNLEVRRERLSSFQALRVLDMCLCNPDSPCIMCTGAILLYKIPRVVIGENANWVGGEELLRNNGVEVVVLDDRECKELMGRYIRENPEVSH